MGNHRLVCGDSLDGDVVSVLMNGETTDMAFTDPPYNINMDQIKHPKFKQREIANDHQSPENWSAFVRGVATVLKRNVDGCVYVCHAPGPDGRIQAQALDDVLHWSATVAWVKDSFTLGRGKYHRRYEPIWFGWTTDGKKFSAKRDLDDVWEVPRPKSSPEHPTMKPVELVARALQHASKTGDLVLDLFGGSGTTLIAAHQLDRICYVIELDPGYSDVICQRFYDLTGIVATRDAGPDFRPITKEAA